MPVYLIHQVGSHFFKVGYAKKPKVRLKTLQTGNPEELRLICEFTHNSVADLTPATFIEPTRWVEMDPAKLDEYDRFCHDCEQTLRLERPDGSLLPWYWRPRKCYEPKGQGRERPYLLCAECVPVELISQPGDRRPTFGESVEALERELEDGFLRYFRDRRQRGEWCHLQASDLAAYMAWVDATHGWVVPPSAPWSGWVAAAAAGEAPDISGPDVATMFGWLEHREVAS